MFSDVTLGAKIGICVSMFTLVGAISTFIYTFEDRYMLKEDHENELSSLTVSIKEKLTGVKQEGFDRLDYAMAIQNYRLIDMEVGLINLSIESKLKIPVENRTETYAYDLRELELKREFLIKHKTTGGRNND